MDDVAAARALTAAAPRSRMQRRSQLLATLRPDDRLRGHWVRLQVRLSGMERAIAHVTLCAGDGTPLDRDITRLRPAPAWRGGSSQRFRAICFLPEEAAELRLTAVGSGARAVRATGLSCRPIPRWRAAAQLLLRQPQVLAGLAARPLPLGRARLRDRLRQVLALSAQGGEAEAADHARWTALFDTWTRADFGNPSESCSIGYVVVAPAGGDAALAGTLQSLEAQYAPPARTAPGGAVSFRDAVLATPGDYIGILQAGEVLPRHATMMAAAELLRLGLPDIAIADEDEVDPTGVRHTPSFKPAPNHLLMLSGTLSRGVWFVRRRTLLDHLGSEDDSWAEAIRLRLWLGRHEVEAGRREAGRGFSRRIPFILSHRRPDTAAAPPELLAGIIGQHLARIGAPFTVRPSWPLTLALRADAPPGGRVTIIIPSTLRQPHCLDCITAILRGTEYPDLDLQVAIAQPGPLDAVQEKGAAAIRTFPNATVTWLEAESFNFSWVNNQIIARTHGEHVLLLNDDVSPIRPDWLRWMVAFLQDPAVGVVGARLLYRDGTVQHAGVIMGLSEVGDHAHRHLPGAAPGYMSRAVLPQQLSAVTGACMLLRRSLLARVGGLDEGYPSAFNDVDLALRIGELGYGVVYAPQAELHHLELQTYGSHYAGDRQPFYREEVDRMRLRWGAAWAADPFHNPNLSLDAARHWQAAFPPRIDPAARAADPVP